MLPIDKTLEDEEKLQTDRIKLVKLRDEYARFSKKADLPTQHARAEAAGFTWKDGKAAERTAKGARSSEHGESSQVTKQEQSIQKGKNVQRGNNRAEKNNAQIYENTHAVSWDNSVGVDSWNADRRKRLISAEQRSVRSPVEVGALYDADGKFIFRKKGDGRSVKFSDEQIKKMRRGVLTHNHPGPDYGCFSPADIEMLRQSYLREIRCATPEGVFSIQRPARWSSKINDFDKIKKTYYDIYGQVEKDNYARAFRGEVPLIDAENISQRVAVEEMCRRYNMPLRFESWDELAKG